MTNDGFLNIEPEVGKWYISDGIESGPEQLGATEESTLVMKRILAGPFVSQEAADDELAWFAERHEPFSWTLEYESPNAPQGEFDGDDTRAVIEK